MIGVTGATGQLGQLVIRELQHKVPSEQLVAAVRSPEKAASMAADGIHVRRADYDEPESLAEAFQGIERLLLISSSEVGQRAPQHSRVIDAAKSAGVELIAYTSILRADSNPMPLAPEHQATENMLRDSGIPYVLLRNGWYNENYDMAVPTALATGKVFGCAGDGRIASASRKDLASAAANVLTSEAHAGKVYELVGDTAYTQAELAQEISKQSGKSITYENLPEAGYAEVLEQAGLPKPFAAMIAQCDTCAANGALFDESSDLRELIGRPTTPIKDSIKACLQSTT